MPVMSRFHFIRGSTQIVWRSQPLSFWLSTMRQVPPYWPTSSTGSITSGDAGRRSSTGGNSPAATFSASMGASAYWPAGTASFHLNAVIADAVRRYLAATEDAAFEAGPGIELLVESLRADGLHRRIPPLLAQAALVAEGAAAAEILPADAARVQAAHTKRFGPT